MRDRLTELISQAQYKGGLVCNLADFLLANGVIVPPVNVGQTVWLYNKNRKNIYKNTVVALKVRGESRHKNKVKVEYRNVFGESSFREYTWAQIGKQVFLTEKDAVEALAEDLRNEDNNENT